MPDFEPWPMPKFIYLLFVSIVNLELILFRFSFALFILEWMWTNKSGWPDQQQRITSTYWLIRKRVFFLILLLFKWRLKILKSPKIQIRQTLSFYFRKCFNYRISLYFLPLYLISFRFVSFRFHWKTEWPYATGGLQHIL